MLIGFDAVTVALLPAAPLLPAALLLPEPEEAIRRTFEAQPLRILRLYSALPSLERSELTSL